MKALRITQSEAWALSLSALTARMFFAVAVERPEIVISGWLCPLLGGCLISPLFLMERMHERAIGRRVGMRKFRLEAAFLPLLLLDGAGMTAALDQLADYTTLTHVRPLWALLPLAACMTLCLWSNGAGLGGGAALWSKLFPLFFLMVLLQHLKSYDFGWLTPALGSGGRSVLEGGLACAGHMVPALLLLRIAEPDPTGGRGRPPLKWAPLWASLLAAVLLALSSAMVPPLVKGPPSRQLLIDTLISNGRASIVTQLPMITVWITGLLTALAMDLFLAAALLQRLIPKYGGKLCLGCACLTAFGMSLAGVGGAEEMRLLASWEYALAFPVFLFSLAPKSTESQGGDLCS